jgi:CheY-like chemotaxis protein
MSSEKKPRYQRVLLIDDTELDNFINREMIRRYGFAQQVFVCSSGKSALEFLNNLVVLGNAALFPELIFVDINMPLMDGFQFIEQFRRISDSVGSPRIAILTSSLSNIDRERADKLSPSVQFLNKPLTIESLKHL